MLDYLKLSLIDFCFEVFKARLVFIMICEGFFSVAKTSVFFLVLSQRIFGSNCKKKGSYLGGGLNSEVVLSQRGLYSKKILSKVMRSHLGGGLISGGLIWGVLLYIAFVNYSD